MGMYPAYTRALALDEYAVTFFALLNEGYRQQSARYRMESQIALLPYLEKDVRTKMLKRLDFAAADPSDILKPSTMASSDEDIKRLFGQK